MSFLATVGSVVKGAYRGIKASLMAIENPSYGIEIAKEKVKNFFKTILKVLFHQILSYALILVVIIAAAGVIFEMFAFFQNLSDPFDVNVANVSEWADELSDGEIDRIQEYGASIHPQKIKKYVEIEENSYPKNVEIKIPIITKVWEDGKLISNKSTSTNYLLKRGDEAYPYRQWWQLIATLDAINETSIDKDRWGIVESAEKDLEPKFKWLNPMVPEMEEGSIYKEGSGAELVITTTTETIKTTSSSDGETTTTTIKETKEHYPLVYLEEAETMFAKYTLEYSPETSSSSSSSSDSYTYTQTKTITDENGEPVTIEETYWVDVHTSTQTVVEDTTKTGITKEYLDTFLMFLDENSINTNSDPEVMYFMAEQMPQNYDFLSELEEYLFYIEDMSLYGEFKGGFGGFEGKYEILPSDLIRNIPLFLQTDPRWSNVPYSYAGNRNHGTIGTSACGPTSAAMIISGLNGYDESIDLNGDGVIDPYEATVYALDKRHRVYGQGTSWGYFADIGKTTGLRVSQKPPNQYSKVLEALEKGNPVVASMGPGVFTRGGHYIVLVGINENGKVIVNDSNSTKRSNAAWDFYNPILSQAKQFWIFSK